MSKKKIFLDGVFSSNPILSLILGLCPVIIATQSIDNAIGMSMAVNKIKGIRCAHCTDPFSAEMTRRHNNANVLALGAGLTGTDLALRMVEVFLNTEFEGGRHARRVGLVDSIQP